jgi:hypothetical protein
LLRKLALNSQWTTFMPSSNLGVKNCFSAGNYGLG